jgi:hypothetical protein
LLLALILPCGKRKAVRGFTQFPLAAEGVPECFGHALCT